MFAKVLSGTTLGLEGIKISVEVDIATRGLPSFQIVGLPSKAVDEARVRVSSAIKNSGFVMPRTRVVVNLAPAHIKKEGSLFDLPIAIGILSAQGVIRNTLLEKSLFVGELSLNGRITEVVGIVPILLSAQQYDINNVFLPAANAIEATLITDINVFQVHSLLQIVRHFTSDYHLSPSKGDGPQVLQQKSMFAHNFSAIKGQQQAKRALEITAAGSHNAHLYGPPGTGKTMLARALPSILPPMDREEMLELAKIHSILHVMRSKSLLLERPFRAPHHTISRIGLTGGGGNILPGEITLAHRGILFLDELPEYPRHIIESLRQPMEDGFVSITRSSGVARFPCRFTLIAASNPCPCGYLGHPTKQCVCSSADIIRYNKKISGPIIDRIDIHVHVPPLDHHTISASGLEPSVHIRDRVTQARLIQKKRFFNSDIKTNCEMTPQHIRTWCTIEKPARDLLKQAFEKLSLSPRSYYKTIKVAQTIADLNASRTIRTQHMAEALQYRYKDR